VSERKLGFSTDPSLLKLLLKRSRKKFIEVHWKNSIFGCLSTRKTRVWGRANTAETSQADTIMILPRFLVKSPDFWSEAKGLEIARNRSRLRQTRVIEER
jgi:hypothetical protein